MANSVRQLRWDIETIDRKQSQSLEIWYSKNKRGGEFCFDFPSESEIQAATLGSLQLLAIQILISVDEQSTEGEQLKLKCDWHDFVFSLPNCDLVSNAVKLFDHCEQKLSSAEDLGADVTAGYILGLIRNDFFEHARAIGMSMQKNGNKIAERNRSRKWMPDRSELVASLIEAWRRLPGQKTECIKQVASSYGVSFRTAHDRIKEYDVENSEWQLN